MQISFWAAFTSAHFAESKTTKLLGNLIHNRQRLTKQNLHFGHNKNIMTETRHAFTVSQFLSCAEDLYLIDVFHKQNSVLHWSSSICSTESGPEFVCKHSLGGECCYLLFGTVPRSATGKMTRAFASQPRSICQLHWCPSHRAKWNRCSSSLPKKETKVVISTEIQVAACDIFLTWCIIETFDAWTRLAHWGREKKMFKESSAIYITKSGEDGEWICYQHWRDDIEGCNRSPSHFPLRLDELGDASVDSAFPRRSSWVFC